MAFGNHCGEKKLEFSHQNSALPMIFFKVLQKARISRNFQIRALRKTEQAEPSFLTKSSSQNQAKPSNQIQQFHNWNYSISVLHLAPCSVFSLVLSRVRFDQFYRSWNYDITIKFQVSISNFILLMLCIEIKPVSGTS